jgi:arginyl-tRNA synthetase
MAAEERLGVPVAAPPKTFVIDYSSPNVAKPMHVGHLRSTIIGNALDRLFRFLGHKVIADNHLGDWGTQFGILIYGYKHFRDEAALLTDPVREMVRLYLLVREQIKAAGGGEDEEEAVNPIAEACRQETAKLHAGDAENVALWNKMMPWCLAELDKIYRRLDVRFDYTHGESFYNPMLPGVVTDLVSKGLAEPSEGAIVVFHSREVDENGKLKQPPSIVRKRDGAFTYTTSDLATIQYRLTHFHPAVILYVVDFRQASHFQPMFAIARRWGVTDVALEHISFGSVLGEDRKPIKTREGGAIELEHLLDEAVERARKIVDENSPELSEAERRQVAEAVGIGAVKYADLSQNRTSNYVFSWDKMLAMDGNTATYMQYAYARVQSVFRKGSESPEWLREQPPLPALAKVEERALALALLQFPEALDSAAAEYMPHAITAYLWELANAYSGFYQNCPVLKAESPELRRSRLLLCDLTARTLQLGLSLLGIRTPDKM